MKRTIKVGLYFYVKSIEEWGIFLVKSWIFVINSPKVISRKINCLLIQSLIQYFPFIPNPQIFSTKVITCLWDRRSEICHHNTKKIVLLELIDLQLAIKIPSSSSNHTVWKKQKFTLVCKIFREINLHYVTSNRFLYVISEKVDFTEFL